MSKADLREAMLFPAMQEALQEIKKRAKEMDKLTNSDLTTPAGINAALVRQGTVRGLLSALDIFTELSAEDKPNVKPK